MSFVNAKCTNCGTMVVVDDQKDADICPHCKNAFVTEKAIMKFSAPQTSIEDEMERKNKRRWRWKSLGLALLFIVKCIGYLFYTICLMWLFFDIVDGVKKK